MSPKQNGFLHPAMHAKWATYMWPVRCFIELYAPFPSLRVFLNGMISGSFVACCSCLFCNCVHSPFFILSCEFILSACPPRVQAPKLGEIQMGRLDEEGEGPTVSPSRAASKCGALPQEDFKKKLQFAYCSFVFKRNMHRLTTGLVLVGICVVLLALCTYGLLRYYREKSVSFGYSLTIYITWYGDG